METEILLFHRITALVEDLLTTIDVHHNNRLSKVLVLSNKLNQNTHFSAPVRLDLAKFRRQRIGKKIELKTYFRIQKLTSLSK
jgi:hypothetical protein